MRRSSTSSSAPRTARGSVATWQRGLAVPLLAFLVGCRSYESRLESFRESYHAGDFGAAQEEVDELIADENDLDADDVRARGGIPDGVDLAKGNTLLFALDRAMSCLGTGELESGTALLRTSRDRLDDVFERSFWDMFGSLLVDEEATTYRGHDYEHVLVRAMLAVFDLVAGTGDAYAYALQLRERQEQILASDFGQEVNYNAREQYQRVSIGAYLAGVIKEGALEADEAALAYEDAREFFGPSLILDAALARTRGEGPGYAGEGEGVLHVFYLAGRGPFLNEVVDVPSDIAARIASLVAEHLARSGGTPVGALFQGPVEVPAAVVLDPVVAPLAIASAGMRIGATEVLLDVNGVVRQQLAANLPLYQARAIVRRTLKSVAVTKTGDSLVGKRDRGLGDLLGAVASFASTAGERADTRCWGTLPAQIQVARIPLPEGDQTLDLGGAGTAAVRITRGRDSYVVVLRPNLGGPGVVLVDAYSRPVAP